MKYFQHVEDIGDLKAAVKEALEVKANRFAYKNLGENKTLMMIFFNSSLRTRLSTQKAAMNLGMNVIVLDVNQGAWKLETERGVIMDGDKPEHLLEAIPVMGCYCDVIGVRSFAHGANEADVMHTLNNTLGEGYTVKNRLMQQAEAFRMVNIEKWVTFLLLGFILVIATFNVIGALSLLIIEKSDSIDTFRNLGASNKLIIRIFVMEGWVISLLGAVLGIVLGLALCLIQEHFGLIEMQGNAATLIITAYPVAVQWTDLLVVLALSLAVGALTSLVTKLIMRRKLR